MPYRDYTAAPVRRYDTRQQFLDAYAETGERQYPVAYSDSDDVNLTSLDLATRAFKSFFETNLGFAIGEDGKVPKDANRNSRMYIVKKDSRGNDQFLEYDGEKLSDGTELKMYSPEFYDQLQMGNVFAYPLGDDDPVQVQLRFDGGSYNFSCSQPIVSDNIADIMAGPAPVVPPQPNAWRRLMHNWFGGYKADFEAIEQAQQARREWENRRSDLARQISIKSAGRKLGHVYEEKEAALQKKQAEVRQAEIDRANEKKNALGEKLNYAGIHAEDVKRGAALSHAIYEPEPKIIETDETKRLFPGRTVQKDGVHELLHHAEHTDSNGSHHNAGGFYDKDSFGNLTVLSKDKLDLSSIKVGKTGKSVTREQFCDLALFAGMDPKDADIIHQSSPAYDPTLRPALQNITRTVNGEEERVFSDEEIDVLISSSYHSMFTTDTHKTSPRDASGKYIKPSIDPARIRTADALNEYKKGNPDKLGQILAVGVNQWAGSLSQMENGIGEEHAGGIEASKTLVDLIQADPKLKEAALKAGMKEKNLWLVEGSLQLGKLRQEALDANVKLLQAAYDGTDLSPEEKKAALKSIVKANVAMQAHAYENLKGAAPMIKQYGEQLSNGAMAPVDAQHPGGKYYDDNGELIMPKKGTLYMASGCQMAETMKCMYREKPTGVMLLKTPSMQKNLDTIADEIIAQDNLMSLTTEELTQKHLFNTSVSGTEYGQRGLSMLARPGMITEDTIKELKQELKTGVEVPKKAKPVQEAQPEGPKVDAPKPNATKKHVVADSIRERANIFESHI